MMRNQSLLVFVLCLLGFVRTQNLYELLKSKQNKDLSEFLKLVEQEPLSKLYLTDKRVTLFAPTNEALKAFKGEKTKDLVPYHLCNEDLDTEKLKQQRSHTSLKNNAVFWVNVKQKSNRYDSELYINNAKIIRDDERGLSSEGTVQLLHVIDQVLQPIHVKKDAPYRNPTTMEVMRGGTNYMNGKYDLTKFARQVEQKNMRSLFSQETPTTYFIPLSQGLESERWGQIDEETIYVHAVPGEVLFTRTVDEGKEYPSALHNNGLHVNLIMKNVELDNGTKVWHAQSQTLVGDTNHPQGIVGRKILKANIPIKNGVIHIIEKPLAVIDQTLSAFLTSEKEVRLTQFHKLLTNYAQWFQNVILENQEITLLAPNNEAFHRIQREYNALVSDQEKLKTVLDFHIVKGRRMSFQYDAGTTGQATTLNGDNMVYFRLIKTHDKSSQVLTVDGGGVNATVTQPDIATTNGIVHIIDRVLGIPFTTVGDRVEEDPDIRKTAELGRNDGFNKRLKNNSTKYTYFAPNNDAWNKVQRSMPSAKKKLFMKQFKYHAKQILERHLLVGEAHTMADLYKLSRGSNSTIRTMRGHFSIIAKGGDGGYQIKWNQQIANVVRPDVKSTNGMIHVIDHVLMVEKDVTVSVATSLGASILTMLALLFAAKYL